MSNQTTEQFYQTRHHNNYTKPETKIIISNQTPEQLNQTRHYFVKLQNNRHLVSAPAQSMMRGRTWNNYIKLDVCF